MRIREPMKLRSILVSSKTTEHENTTVCWPGTRNWEKCLSLVESVLASSTTPLDIDGISSKIRLKRGVRINRDLTTVLYHLEKAGIVRRLSKKGIAYFSVKTPTVIKEQKTHSGLPPYVSKKGKKFKARVSINGVLTTVGVFNTPEEAHNAAVLAKKQKTVTGIVQENTSIVPERNILDSFVLKVKKLFN